LSEFHGNAEFLSQTESAHAIENTEVDDFGLTSHIGIDHLRKYAENVRGGTVVNIFT